MKKNATSIRLMVNFHTVARMALHVLSAVRHSNSRTNNMPAHFQVGCLQNMWGWVGGSVGGWGGSKGITVIESLGGGRSRRTSSRGIPDIKRGTPGRYAAAETTPCSLKSLYKTPCAKIISLWYQKGTWHTFFFFFFF